MLFLSCLRKTILWSWLAALALSTLVGRCVLSFVVFSDDDGNPGWEDYCCPFRWWRYIDSAVEIFCSLCVIRRDVTWALLKADVTKAHRRVKVTREGWKYQVAQINGSWWINKVGTYGMASAQRT